jgi:3-oxoacyl-[acyl-carrier protein] reductase
MDLGLRGSAVLLAGGTHGIGRATARLLGEEGARVALIGRDPAALDAAAGEVRTRGGEAAPIRADLTDPGQAARAVEEAAGVLGALEVIIDAVGRGFPGAFLETDEVTWRAAFELDLFSAVRLVRLGVPLMSRGGRIVFVGAASARQPHFRQSPSNAAKAALANLMRSLADELAPDIVVNCVAPGRILSERRRQRLEDDASRRGLSIEAALREDSTGIVLGRLGDPAEVAAMVVFLASRRASYITGQSILVDGGLVRAL